MLTFVPAGRTRPRSLFWDTTVPLWCRSERRSVTVPTLQWAARSLLAAFAAVRSTNRGTTQRTVETGIVGVGMDGVVGAAGVVGIAGAGGAAGETRCQLGN